VGDYETPVLEKVKGAGFNVAAGGSSVEAAMEHGRSVPGPGEYSKPMLPRDRVTLEDLKKKFVRAKSKYVESRCCCRPLMHRVCLVCTCPQRRHRCACLVPMFGTGCASPRTSSCDRRSWQPRRSCAIWRSATICATSLGAALERHD
jgi:hypothetical protein